jgi:hypothetical protein
LLAGHSVCDQGQHRPAGVTTAGCLLVYTPGVSATVVQRRARIAGDSHRQDHLDQFVGNGTRSMAKGNAFNPTTCLAAPLRLGGVGGVSHASFRWHGHG